MQIAICDDNMADIETLRACLSKSKLLSLESLEFFCFSSGEAFLEARAKLNEPYDFLFLDNQMGGKNGIETFRALKSLKERDIVIFVSAFPQYVPNIYEEQPFNIICKPVKQENLDFVLSLALREHRRIYEESFVVRIPGESKTLKTADISYLSNDKHYLMIHFANQDNTLRYRGNIDNAEAILLSQGFVRTHRAFLVNLRYLVSIEARRVVLQNQEYVPLGQRRRNAVEIAFLKYKGGC